MSLIISMCHDLLTFLKEVWPLFSAFTIFSKASIIHLPWWVNARTIFVFVDFFVCAAIVGEMFSLSTIDSCNPLHCLQGTTNNMVALCLLALGSKKLLGFN